MATQVFNRVWGGRAAVLGTNQTGNGASTDTLDRGKSTGPAFVEISTTAGATPTVTLAIEGSNDGNNWFAVPYSLVATPTTVAVAAIVVTTSTVTRAYLPGGYAYRYLRVTRSANTNVQVSARIYIY